MIKVRSGKDILHFHNSIQSCATGCPARNTNTTRQYSPLQHKHNNIRATLQWGQCHTLPSKYELLAKRERIKHSRWEVIRSRANVKQCSIWTNMSKLQSKGSQLLIYPIHYRAEDPNTGKKVEWLVWSEIFKWSEMDRNQFNLAHRAGCCPYCATASATLRTLKYSSPAFSTQFCCSSSQHLIAV